MKLKEYLENTNSSHKQQGNPAVAANALYKTKENFNCYLTPAQAMALAQYLLMKARLIEEEGIDDAVVQLWNVGENNETLHCGLIEARKGPRRD